MFALADPYVLRPLPYPSPDELIRISFRNSLPSGGDATRAVVDDVTVADWQRHEALFSNVAAAGGRRTLEFTRHGAFATLRAAEVSLSFFTLFGLSPPAANSWQVNPGQTTELPIAVVEDGTTRVGTLLTSVDGDRWRVVTVLPRSFIFPQTEGERITALTPLTDSHIRHVAHIATHGTATSMLTLFGRLAPGVSVAMANAAIASENARRPARQTEWAVVERLSDVLTRRAHNMAVGAAIAGLLMFIACAANVTNLLATRGAHRLREFAVRQAIGATLVDVARLVFAEVAVLVATATLLSVITTAGVLKIITVVMPSELSTLGTPAVTGRVIVIAIAAGILLTLAGLAPVMGAWRLRGVALFSDAASTESHVTRMLRCVLTAAQSAVAILLLIGGVLLIMSYDAIMAQDIGFARDAFVLTVTYPASQGAARRNVVDGVLSRLQRVPGIRDPAALLGALGTC
jgi:hypothetical protein